MQTVKICEIRAKVNPSEKAALELVAQHERRNLSETLRELIRAEAQRRGLWPPPAEQAEEIRT